MKYETINNGDFIIKQFSWTEKEKIITGEIYNTINTMAPNFYNAYLFGAFNYSYPASFSIKHIGLWKSTIKKYDIKLHFSKEKNIKLNSYGVIYGVSSVHFNEQIFDYLMDYSCNSWLLFSKEEYNIDFLIEKFVQITERGFKILYERLIDYFCEKGDDVLFFINGSAEVALYMISKNHRQPNQGTVL